MSQENVTIDIVKAENWMREVEAEFDAVKRLLEEASTEITTIPGEKDTLLNLIYDAGTKIQKEWNTLNDVFKKVGNEMKEIMEIHKKNANKSVETIKKVAEKIGL